MYTRYTQVHRKVAAGQTAGVIGGAPTRHKSGREARI